MSFVTDDKEVYEKYNEIWNVVKKLLKLKSTASPIRDGKYIITKLKIFKKINLTTFTDNVIPIEKTHYTCIPALDIYSVLKIDKKAYPRAYLEQCKYSLKKKDLQIILILKLLIMIVKMIVIAVIVKMKIKVKIILLNLNNHENVPKILSQLFIKFLNDFIMLVITKEWL